MGTTVSVGHAYLPFPALSLSLLKTVLHVGVSDLLRKISVCFEFCICGAHLALRCKRLPSEIMIHSNSKNVTCYLGRPCSLLSLKPWHILVQCSGGGGGGGACIPMQSPVQRWPLFFLTKQGHAVSFELFSIWSLLSCKYMTCRLQCALCAMLAPVRVPACQEVLPVTSISFHYSGDYMLVATQHPTRTYFSPVYWLINRTLRPLCNAPHCENITVS